MPICCDPSRGERTKLQGVCAASGSRSKDIILMTQIDAATFNPHAGVPCASGSSDNHGGLDVSSVSFRSLRDQVRFLPFCHPVSQNKKKSLLLLFSFFISSPVCWLGVSKKGNRKWWPSSSLPSNPSFFLSYPKTSPQTKHSSVLKNERNPEKLPSPFFFRCPHCQRVK